MSCRTHVDSFTELLDILIQQAGVDGLFTDFPDMVVDFLRKAHHRLMTFHEIRRYLLSKPEAHTKTFLFGSRWPL